MWWYRCTTLLYTKTWNGIKNTIERHTNLVFSSPVYGQAVDHVVGVAKPRQVQLWSLVETSALHDRWPFFSSSCAFVQWYTFCLQLHKRKPLDRRCTNYYIYVYNTRCSFTCSSTRRRSSARRFAPVSLVRQSSFAVPTRWVTSNGHAHHIARVLEKDLL